MKLTKNEADLFFKLINGLYFFVYQKLDLSNTIKKQEDYLKQPLSEKMKARNELFKNRRYIDEYINENPHNLTPENLTIIGKWKDAIKEEFYIERFLKKHAIFISKTDQVYAVCSLYEGLNEMIHSSNLPLLVNTVLLPFAGKIIYDGLFESYNIHFGKGITGSLKEVYLTAKQNNRIIYTFEPQSQSNQSEVKVLKNWEPELTELYEKAKSLKGGVNYPLIYSSAFGLVKNSLVFALEAVSYPGDQEKMYNHLNKIKKELNKAYTVLNRQKQ